MSTKKEARRDAYEFAQAQMAYGEGAGTRRKLIQATVEGKSIVNPAYASAFSKALDDQDLAAHAAKAKKDRFRKDSTQAVTKNVKGLATGNLQSVHGGVLIVLGLGYAAHVTGFDKVALKKTKEVYNRVKKWNTHRQMKAEVHRITSVPPPKEAHG